MNTFFPFSMTDWYELDQRIPISTSLDIFKGRLLQFLKPLENCVYTCHYTAQVIYFTRLKLGVSQLRYHKFKHGFLDPIDPLCS